MRRGSASFGIESKVAPSHDPRRVFTVCHQKFVVIDRKLVVIESANWANTSLPEREAGAARKKGNREWLVRIDDEPIANWYGDLFEADWNVPSLGDPLGLVSRPRLSLPLLFALLDSLRREIFRSLRSPVSR